MPYLVCYQTVCPYKIIIIHVPKNINLYYSFDKFNDGVIRKKSILKIHSKEFITVQYISLH